MNGLVVVLAAAAGYLAFIALVCAFLAGVGDRNAPQWQRCATDGCTTQGHLHADDQGLVFLCRDCANVAHAEPVIPGAA